MKISLYALIRLAILLMILLSNKIVFGEDSSENLFQRYKIPSELKQRPIFYFLKRMEWMELVAKSDNWKDATRHPAMSDNSDFSKLRIEFEYEYRKSSKEYYATSFLIKTHSADISPQYKDAITGDIEFYDDGKVVVYSGRFWVLNFHQTGVPAKFWFSTNNIYPDVKGGGYIEWDDDGKVVDNPYAKSKVSLWDDVYCSDDYVKNLEKQNNPTPISTDQPTDYKLLLPPKTNHTKFVTTFKHIVEYDSCIRSGNVKNMIKNAVFDKQPSTVYAEYYFYERSLASVWLYYLPQHKDKYGCFFTYDKSGRLIRYVRGETYVKRNSGEISNSDVTYPTCAIDGSGIDVRFHTTGYPASYQTIANNRLFGRQIEWNDKGEVLFDVDLDIPKPWADAPKKEEDGGQKK
jgi:hypothetical protein